MNRIQFGMKRSQPNCLSVYLISDRKGSFPEKEKTNTILLLKMLIKRKKEPINVRDFQQYLYNRTDR